MQAKKKKPKNRDAEVCLQQISVSCPINNVAFARQLRCSSVTYRFRYAPSSRPAAAGPAAHFDRNESHVIYGTGH